MPNVMIDPYMFLIEEENEIINNIDFFEQIINLSEAKIISVFVYSGLKEKLLNREVNPFPININKVDGELKKKLLILNNAFCYHLSNTVNEIDISQCLGNQDFVSVPDLTYDPDYYELMSSLLSNCYNQEFLLENVILFGDLHETSFERKSLIIKCECGKSNYEKEFLWCHIDRFIPAKYSAFEKLNKLSEKIEFVYEPELKRAQHHCPLQKNSIKKYSDFTIRNKAVLRQLRSFNLSKIVLTEFHNEPKYSAGTIVITNICEVCEQDILSGWLYCETGFKSGIELYFPKGIGVALDTYLEHMFDYKSVEELKSKLCLKRVK